jgi:hypothetical protein
MACSKNASANINANLTHIKATWRVFQRISADIKDLDDISRYWPLARTFDLPAGEYTAREVRSGVLFWAFAQRRSTAALRLRRPHSAASRALRRLAPRSGLADRQRLRVHRRS